MSNNYSKIKFDEDHMGGQEVFQKYMGVSDYNEFYYKDEHGKISFLFSCSDVCLMAISQLIENKGKNLSSDEIEKINSLKNH